MFRGKVPEDLDKLVRLLATLQNKNLSDVLAEALELWSSKEENQELIKKHNLGN